MDYRDYFSLCDLYFKRCRFILYAHSIWMGNKYMALRAGLYSRQRRSLFSQLIYRSTACAQQLFFMVMLDIQPHRIRFGCRSPN